MPVSDYFQPLMKRLRSYIARLLVTLLVCSGFSLYMVQSAQAGQTSDGFARWLGMMAEASDAPGLKKELQDLKTSGGQLSEMLEQASQIVTQNNDEFDFPFAAEQASRELYRLLLIEWNQFQTGNGRSSRAAVGQIPSPVAGGQNRKPGIRTPPAVFWDIES